MKTVEQAANEYQRALSQVKGYSALKEKKALKEYEAAIEREKAQLKRRGVR